MELALYIVFLIIFVYFAICYFKLIGPLVVNDNLPPGPWGLPIFGHLFFLGRKPYRTLLEWGKQYGPIIYCRFGSYPTVVLQESKLIKQAFSMPEMSGRAEILPFVKASQRKGIIFSEAPHSTQQRQFALRNLKDQGMGRKTLIESKIRDDLLDFLDSIKRSEGIPLSSCRLTNKYVVSTLWTILMTEKLSHNQLDHLAQIFREKGNQVGSVLSQLALFMPWMENWTKFLSLGYVSLVDFKREGFEEIYNFIGSEISVRKGHRVQGQPSDLMDFYLDHVNSTRNISSSFHPQNNFSQYFCGDLFMAGVETVSTTLEWFFLYVIKTPGVQKKLQEEIDKIVDSSRLPSLSDKPAMPYVSAVIYETLRASSLLPLGLHHRTLSDVKFQNYTIPKNTMILANLHAVHHDEKVWGDPQNFRPERWLSPEGAQLKAEHFLAFTCGKRSCVGEALAKDELFLYAASLCQRFTLSFPDGKEPKCDIVEGFAISPEPFKILFTSRECKNQHL